MRRRDVLSGAAGAAVAATSSGAQPSAPAAGSSLAQAEMILRNGKIVTMDTLFTIADSIAIGGGKVLAAGPHDAMAPFIAEEASSAGATKTA